jgi:hypothetical protein
MTILASIRRTVVKELDVRLQDFTFRVAFAEDTAQDPGALIVDGIGPNNIRISATYASGSPEQTLFRGLAQQKIDTDPTIEKLPSEVGDVGVGGLSAAPARTRALK